MTNDDAAVKSLIVLLPMLVAACAGGPANTAFSSSPGVICAELLGTGWAPLPAPPGIADDLLALPGVHAVPRTQTLWLSGHDGAIAVCFAGEFACYSGAHVFRRSDAGYRVDDADVKESVCVA